MRSIFFKLKQIDKMLAIVCLLLTLLGLAIIYSISLSAGASLFYKQATYALVGIFLFSIFVYVDYSELTKINRWFYLVSVLLLLGIFKLGTHVNGSARWYNFKLFLFQPAEFTKLVVILVLARFFALRRGEINTWKNILLSLLYVLIPAVLISREPDLGSTIILLIIWGGMLLMTSVHRKFFVYLFLALAAFSAFSWTYMLHDFQKSRIETFLDPNLDPHGRGYNVKQATIAVGSGSLFGRGLGKGLQSQLRFLPERDTDFVFASAAEELGFVGTMVMIILYFMLLWRLLILYQKASDDLGRYIIAGVFFMLFGQVVINIGMNMGILPVTGIPLPFITYGGSSFLTLAISLGVAESVVVRSKGLHWE